MNRFLGFIRCLKTCTLRYHGSASTACSAAFYAVFSGLRPALSPFSLHTKQWIFRTALPGPDFDLTQLVSGSSVLVLVKDKTIMSEVSFVEMGSMEPEKTSHFFAALLGWTFHPIASQASPGSGWFETSTGKVGLHGNDAAGAVLYFRVEDIETAVAHVRSLGGTAEDAIANEPGFGRFCNCIDPQGLRFGLHQLA